MRLAEGVEVVHFIPGRVRLKVRRAKADSDFARVVRERLVPIPGIRRVEVHAVTGSVLVQYDPAAVARAENVERLVGALGTLFPEADVGILRQWLSGVSSPDSD